MLPEPTRITVGELRVVHNTVERMAQSMFSGEIDETSTFELSATEHWIILGVCERSFGFWRTTMALYEADEHGAMGDEEITP